MNSIFQRGAQRPHPTEALEEVVRRHTDIPRNTTATGVEYERANFTRLLAAQQMGLSATRRWAESTMAAVAAGEQQQQQPGTPWLLSAADHALCTAPPASSAGEWSTG